MRLPLLIAAVVAMVTGLVAGAEIAFRGYMTAAGRHLFVLSSAQRNSDWISIGQTFGNSKILEFDPATETLTIETAGVRRELRMRQPGEVSNSVARLEFAHEIAKKGDPLLVALLRRYEEAVVALQAGKGSQAAIDYLAAHIEETARRTAASEATLRLGVKITRR